ncbi:MAG: hypothetical protein AAB451_02455 [Patescibacteria group bacterium]
MKWRFWQKEPIGPTPTSTPLTPQDDNTDILEEIQTADQQARQLSGAFSPLSEDIEDLVAETKRATLKGRALRKQIEVLDLTDQVKAKLAAQREANTRMGKRLTGENVSVGTERVGTTVRHEATSATSAATRRPETRRGQERGTLVECPDDHFKYQPTPEQPRCPWCVIKEEKAAALVKGAEAAAAAAAAELAKAKLAGESTAGAEGKKIVVVGEADKKGDAGLTPDPKS